MRDERLDCIAGSLLRGIASLVSLTLIAAQLSPLSAQAWNSPAALALVRRAVERRLAVQADSSLTSYHTRAHGFLFFLAQVGEQLSEAPRLVKADELEVEVYWQAPDRSKQVILGWRDGKFLPTDINYHRDHLGIVTNNFGNTIRIGEGDEVRDVAHPLSPAGLQAYDFALSDSAAIRTAEGEITVYQIQVRPRSFARPLVVGTMYLDIASAELVRFRFSFTPVSYRDRELEDINVVLENRLYQNRYWLPYRQEIEIRRRVSWLDFPARGIIRGRWEIEDYDLNPDLPPSLFAGPTIAGLTEPRNADTSWSEPLNQAIAGVAQPVNRQDMEGLRVEVERIAASRMLAGLPSTRLAAGSLSDLAHVNRVQGLTLGFGGVVGLKGSRLALRPSVAYGTSDDRLTGSLRAAWTTGSTEISLTASRTIRDFSDLPVIAPLMNSIMAQEGGNDHGDYVLLHDLMAGVRRRVSGRTAISLDLGIEESKSVSNRASAATGSYRSNPALGSGSFRIARLGLEQSSGGIGVRRDLLAKIMLEGGEGPKDYARVAAEARWSLGLGGTQLLIHGYLGAGTNSLPPHRSFVLGGRGTLLGEPYRAFGGRSMALSQLEWRFDVPVPAISLGSYATTGKSATMAPFLALGYAGRGIAGLPWTDTDGVRPVVGIAFEWLMHLFRLEVGVGLRQGDLGVTLDVNRDWWGLL